MRGRLFGGRLFEGRLFGPSDEAPTQDLAPLPDTGAGRRARLRAQQIELQNNQLMVLVAAIAGSGCLDQ